MRVSNTRPTTPMSRRRTKRPDGGVYRELRKGRPVRGFRKTLRRLEFLLMGLGLLAVLAAAYWWWR